MQYGVLDWIQTQDICGKTDEIQVWNLENSKFNVSFLIATKALRWAF